MKFRLRPLLCATAFALLAACSSTPTTSSLGALPEPSQASIEQLLNQAGASQSEQANLLRLTAADKAYAQQNTREARQILGSINLEGLKPAQQMFAQAARRLPKNVEAYVQWGQATYEAGAPQQALGILQRALAIDPDTAAAYYYLGFAHYRLGHKEAAAAAFREATRCAPHFAEAYYQLGRVLEKQGLDAGARQALQQALMQKPDYTDAALALDALESRNKGHATPG